MASFLTNLGAAGRGLTAAYDTSRRREREDQQAEQAKKDAAFVDEQRKLLAAQSQQQMGDIEFQNQLRAIKPNTDTPGMSQDDQLLDVVSRRRDFALQAGRADEADKLAGAYEKLRQNRIERVTEDAFRGYQRSGDLNELTKAFDTVQDGRKNFRFDGDDQRGYTLSFEMADGQKRSIPFKDRAEAEQGVYSYIKPMERVKNEIAYRDWERRQNLLNGNRIDAKAAELDARMEQRFKEMEARNRQGGAGGRSGSGRGGGDAPNPKPGDTIKDMKGYAEILSNMVPAEGQQADAAKGYEVYSRLRETQPQMNDAARLALSLDVETGKSSLRPPSIPMSQTHRGAGMWWIKVRTWASSWTRKASRFSARRMC
jgi:hypothetical protein